MRPLAEQELDHFRILLRHLHTSRLKDAYQAIWLFHLEKSVQGDRTALGRARGHGEEMDHRFEEDVFDGLADDNRSEGSGSSRCRI